jgi:hypothetical protein
MPLRAAQVLVFGPAVASATAPAFGPASARRAATAAPATEPGKWPRPWRVAFILAAAGVCWLPIILPALALL